MLLPLAFVALWSTGFIVARAIEGQAEPATFLALRFAASAALFALAAVVMGRALAPDRVTVWHMTVSGAILFGIYLVCGYWAVVHGLPAAVMSLLGALQPVLTALISRFVLGEAVTPTRVLGIAAGFIGVVLVLAPKLAAASEAATPTLVVLVGLLGVASITAGGFYQKRFLPSSDVVVAGAWKNVGAALATLPLMIATGTYAMTWSPVVTGAFLWSVLAMSVGSGTLLVMLIARGQVTAATSWIFLAPPLAAQQAFALFGEALAPIQLLGMALAGFGVWLVTKS
jgi:drug/metabolite transporter (DMT)-like permease